MQVNGAGTLRGVKRIHLAGIGGIGVSALAPMLINQGYIVTGSDPASNEVTDRLKAAGVTVFHEHKAENLQGVDLLVYSSAIKPDNPERARASEMGIPVWHRSEMLGYLMKRQRGIVISGAHGKTTVTSMITQMLLDADLDPTAFIGGDLPRIGGNSRIGGGEWVVVEGDESDGSFVNLFPEIAIVNNIDADHLDYYKDLDEIKERFRLFLQKVPAQGWIVYSADSEHCVGIAEGLAPKTLTYGFAETAEIRASNYSAGSQGSGCDVTICRQHAGRLELLLSGRTNCHNALAAVAVAVILGISFETAARSLGAFAGVHRRMEWKGQAGGVTVLDDYAHHPAEIRATVQALRDRFSARIIGVFQPHLYSRTLKFLEEFGQSFVGLDELVLMDIYPAREKPMPGVTGEVLLEPVRRNGVPVQYRATIDETTAYLLETAREGSVVVTLGAGSVFKVGEEFLRQASGGEGRPA